MKRKLLNAALFGAVLVAAPVSTFVSCADYDSDITDLQKQVDDLKSLVDLKEGTIKTEIANLQEQDKALAAKIAELEKAQAACKANCAEELAKCKSDLQKAIDNSKAELEDKLAESVTGLETKLANSVADLEGKLAADKSELEAAIAQCKADCETARAQINLAISDLEKALKEADKKLGEDIASLMEKDGELQKGIDKAQADAAAVQDNLDKVEGELKGLIEDLQGQVDGIKTSVSGLLTAVAALETTAGNNSNDIKTIKNDVEDLTNGLNNTQEDVKNLVEGAKGLQVAVNEVKEKVGDIDSRLTALENQLQGKLDDVLEQAKNYVNQITADLVGQIAGNTTLINELTQTVNDNKEAFETWKKNDFAEAIDELKKVDGNLADKCKDLFDSVETLEDGLSVTQKDVMDLSDGLHELQTDMIDVIGKIDGLTGRVDGLDGRVDGINVQVLKNTKAIVDLAARMVEAELKIDNAVKDLGLLQEELAAFKIAQDAIDVAQDARIDAAIEGYIKAQATADSALDKIAAIVEGEYGYDNINKAYKAAVDYAQAAADLAKDNAKTYAENYANSNFYNKAKVDELVDALKAADAQRDADFQMWIEQVLNPAFDDVWAELLDEDGNSRLSVLEDGLANTQQDVFNLTEGLRQVILQADQNAVNIAANKAKIEEVEEAYKAADAQMAADFRAWIEQELNPAFEEVWNAISDLKNDVVSVSTEVKSFVLEPASYYEGIQAIEGTSYEYHKWNVSDATNPIQESTLVQYCPEVVAKYHVNPSKAQLSTEVGNYSYAVLDRTNRGVNTQLQPVVTKVAQDGGMLDVTLKLGDASANKTPQGHADPSEVTVMALQYKNPSAKAENQVVTSDYAVLYLNPLKEVSLVSATDTDHEITDVFAQVVPNNDQDWVEYTSSYDIQEQLAAKFGGENSVSMTELPEGFTVKYTPVYGDVTYFTPITADGKVTPQLPNGQPATTACVGKTATWRIDIMHGEDVVEVGFYKLTITGEAVIETAPAVITEDILKITCVPDAEALNKNLSIENVWNKIAEVTGEEVAVVKGKYSVTTADDKVVQYKEYKSEADRVLYKQYEGKGVITLKADGTVNWTVLDNDPYVASDLRSSTEDVKSMKTFIRVRSNDAISKDTYNEFYMPLVWTPQPIEFWGEYQELSWTYTRVANQWQQSTNVAEEKELRLYADLTKNGSTPFTYDIPAKAMVDFDYTKLTFVGTAKDFVNVKNGNIGVTDGHFRFIEHPNVAARKTTVGGVEYVFTVSADGKQFLANDVEIATITEQGVVNLVNNATSQLLLNAYEKNQLAYGETLCARVGFAAKCCAGLVEVIDGDFDVRFIKPLTVNAADINISDADDILNAGKITTSILNNIVCFNNYTLAERPNYIGVFGVGIELGNVAEWKTNYNAAADDFTKSLGDNHIDELFAKNEAQGEITYTNNTAVVNEFSVIVPVKVHYNWYLDPISVNIKLNVGRTQGNSHRR